MRFVIPTAQSICSG